MDILNELVSVPALQHFIDVHKDQKGVIRLITDRGDCGDIRLTFVKNENRHHYLNISSNQVMELSHTVPGLQYRAPDNENERADYHRDRVKAYVQSHGYYVWGSGYEFAEWVCFVRADQLDDETCVHYSVPQDHIELLLRKPGYMTRSFKSTGPKSKIGDIMPKESDVGEL